MLSITVFKMNISFNSTGFSVRKEKLGYYKLLNHIIICVYDTHIHTKKAHHILY